MSLTSAQEFCLREQDTLNLESNCEIKSDEDGDISESLIFKKQKLVNIAASHPDKRSPKRRLFQSPDTGATSLPYFEVGTRSCFQQENLQFDDELMDGPIVIPSTSNQQQSSTQGTTPILNERTNSTPTNKSQNSTVSLNLIYTKLCSIEFEVKQSRRQLNARIDTLEKKIFDFITRTARSTADCENVPLFLADLPAKDDTVLMHINERIKSNENDMEELVNALYFCGGENMHKGVFAQMKKLLRKEVSLLYSGEGKKNKKSFVSLEIYSAVIRAVRRRFQDATDKDIKKAVSLFLTGAKDREGGRRSRNTLTNAPVIPLNEFQGE